jgi:PRC-barrel domain
MLRNISDLKGSKVIATDGDVGKIEHVYFDDVTWGLRYLVVDTGSWLHRRKVLISPYSILRGDEFSRTVHLKLSRQEVQDSPKIDTHKPVSRQHETELLGYYGYPPYWEGPSFWGMGGFPDESLVGSGPVPVGAVQGSLTPSAPTPAADIRLRNADEVRSYHIEAADGNIGQVSGFLFDDAAWVIRYVTVDTRSWWTGGSEVLLATQWIDGIDFETRTVSTSLTRDAVKDSPDYDLAVPLNRSYETQLHSFYGRRGYWL